MNESQSIFHDLNEFVATERFTGLSLSPDGSRLIAARTSLNSKNNAYVTALWELPNPDGSPRRLTRGLDGESLSGFTHTGDLLFTAKRDTGEDDDETRLFLLPRDGGEARVVAKRHSGFSSLSVAEETGRIALVSPVFPGAKDVEDDARIAKERGEKKMTGILHTGYPVRAWDHDLGPARPQLFVAEPLDPADPDAELELRQVTSLPASTRLFGGVIGADGSRVFATVSRATRGIQSREEVVSIDMETGEVTTLAAADDADFSLAAVSPDSSLLLVARATRATREVSLKIDVHVLDLATGELGVRLDFEDWPSEIRIARSNTEAFFTADHEGRGGIFRADLLTGTVELLTSGRFHYGDLALNLEDGTLVALQDAIDQPPLPVRLDTSSREVSVIDSGLSAPAIPGTLTEFETTAADGSTIRSWLALPHSASASAKAPLLLFIHGGPFGSWNSWTWRWNPWVAVARGYAVLLPDPAISTGYGQAMLDRGWSELGGAPFDDIMRATKDALAREDIDETKKAALGGSYGGYMANWVAGHTGDFFDCIVTHASLWNLDQFRHTTDAGEHWGSHLSDSHVAEHNPADFVGDIVAPMLVIHGDKDYRVPIGEGLRLWYELLEASDQSPEEMPHRFLYFPNENHWILTPNNSVTWYETVLAFVDRHVHGKQSEYPELLGL